MLLYRLPALANALGTTYTFQRFGARGLPASLLPQYMPFDASLTRRSKLYAGIWAFARIALLLTGLIGHKTFGLPTTWRWRRLFDAAITTSLAPDGGVAACLPPPTCLLQQQRGRTHIACDVRHSLRALYASPGALTCQRLSRAPP